MLNIVKTVYITVTRRNNFAIDAWVIINRCFACQHVPSPCLDNAGSRWRSWYRYCKIMQAQFARQSEEWHSSLHTVISCVTRATTSPAHRWLTNTRGSLREDVLDLRAQLCLKISLLIRQADRSANGGERCLSAFRFGPAKIQSGTSMVLNLLICRGKNY